VVTLLKRPLVVKFPVFRSQLWTDSLLAQTAGLLLSVLQSYQYEVEAKPDNLTDFLPPLLSTMSITLLNANLAAVVLESLFYGVYSLKLCRKNPF
jgi:hypothetical protein